MRSYGLTDKGSVREENQDCFKIEYVKPQKFTLAVLCDGMGGANGGSIASSQSLETFSDSVLSKLSSRRKTKYNIREVLLDACRTANSFTYEFSMFDDSLSGMGTTLVGGIIRDDGECHIVNVGDSRAYYLSRKTRTIRQITKDHSLVEELIEYGAITREQARTHPQKNVITRAVGAEPEVEADYFDFKLLDNDVLILCSDGLAHIVREWEILDFALEYETPELIVKSLMNLALYRGARDNVTIAAVCR